MPPVAVLAYGLGVTLVPDGMPWIWDGRVRDALISPQAPDAAFESADVLCENAIVELDEEQHFNRYRATTFDAAAYRRSRAVDVPQYLTFCREFEQECLRSARRGGYWTNPSAETEFGPSGQPGALD